MPAGNDPYVATQIFSEFQYSDDVSNRRRFSANLIGKNGFICYIQKKKEDNGYWENLINFYLNEHDMTYLAIVIDMVVKDLKNDNFGKIRTMKGSKSNMKFLTRKKDDKVYIGIRIVQREDGHETSKSADILLPTGNIYDEHKGIHRLEIFSQVIKDTYTKRNDYKSIQYERYSKEIDRIKSDKDEELSKGNPDNPFNDMDNDDGNKNVDPDDDRFDIPDEPDEEDVKEAGKILDDLDKGDDKDDKGEK